MYHRAKKLDTVRNHYRRLRNRLLFSDPGLARFTFAVRTILALLLAGLLCQAVAKWGNFGNAGVILAVIAVQLTSLLARQPRRRDRIATCLVMLPGNWAGVLLLYALQGNPHLDVFILPLLIGAGFLAQAFNARLGAALLAAAWIFMFTLYLSAAGTEPMWHLVAVTLGILSSMLLRFVIWRDDRTLSASLLVLSHRLVLIDFAELAARQGISNALTRMLWRMQPIAGAVIENPRMSGPIHDALADLRLTLEVAILKTPSCGLALANSLRSDSRVTGHQEIDRAQRRVDSCLADVRLMARDSTQPTGFNAMMPVKPTRDSMVKRSAQVFVATGIAATIGYQMSDHYWTWAVIVAMFLFFGTESAGHILDKGLNSAIGVVLGVLAGIFLTEAFGTIPQVELVLIPLLLFMALYLMPVNYAMGAAMITTILGLVYQLLGLPAPSIMLLRLGEVLAGAAAGTLAALLVFPHRPLALLNHRTAHLIAGLADAIDPKVGETIHRAELRRRFAAAFAVANLGRLGGLMIERSRVKSSLADLSRLVHLVEVLRRLQSDDNSSMNEAAYNHRLRLADALRELARHMDESGATNQDETRVAADGDIASDTDTDTDTDIASYRNSIVQQLSHVPTEHASVSPRQDCGLPSTPSLDNSAFDTNLEISKSLLRSFDKILQTLTERELLSR